MYQFWLDFTLIVQKYIQVEISIQFSSIFLWKVTPNDLWKMYPLLEFFFFSNNIFKILESKYNFSILDLFKTVYDALINCINHIHI